MSILKALVIAVAFCLVLAITFQNAGPKLPMGYTFDLLLVLLLPWFLVYYTTQPRPPAAAGQPVRPAMMSYTIASAMIVIVYTLAFYFWGYPAWRSMYDSTHPYEYAARIVYAARNDKLESLKLHRVDGVLISSIIRWRDKTVSQIMKGADKQVYGLADAIPEHGTGVERGDAIRTTIAKATQIDSEVALVNNEMTMAILKHAPITPYIGTLDRIFGNMSVVKIQGLDGITVLLPDQNRQSSQSWYGILTRFLIIALFIGAIINGLRWLINRDKKHASEFLSTVAGLLLATFALPLLEPVVLSLGATGRPVERNIDYQPYAYPESSKGSDVAEENDLQPFCFTDKSVSLTSPWYNTRVRLAPGQKATITITKNSMRLPGLPPHDGTGYSITPINMQGDRLCTACNRWKLLTAVASIADPKQEINRIANIGMYSDIFSESLGVGDIQVTVNQVIRREQGNEHADNEWQLMEGQVCGTIKITSL